MQAIWVKGKPTDGLVGIAAEFKDALKQVRTWAPLAYFCASTPRTARLPVCYKQQAQAGPLQPALRPTALPD